MKKLTSLVGAGVGGGVGVSVGAGVDCITQKEVIHLSQQFAKLKSVKSIIYKKISRT